MNILIAKFTLESNEHVPMMCDMEHTALSFGEKALTHMQFGDLIEREDINFIPVLCADAACSGVMTKNCFDYLETRILNAVRAHLSILDGIYLHLHGASFVEEYGSGEQHLVAKIRELVGPYLPIAVACDPHGNLTKEYVENTNYIRSYRESPHIDIEATVRKTVEALIERIERPTRAVPVYRKLPLILGGEQSVSADEPVKTINVYLNKLEEDPRIKSASWHVGYLRHDCPEAGCGVVVIPASEADQAYTEEKANELADFVWSKRYEFHYTGTTAEPTQALEMVLQNKDGVAFLTDSGDNVTSGAMGANTFVLKQVLESKTEKRVLVAGLNDPRTCRELWEHKPRDTVHISLGMGIDELSAALELDVELLALGTQEGTAMYGEDGDYGPIATVRVCGTHIDIAVTNNNHSFAEQHQIFACGVDWDDYDVIIVKQGYIHPELKAKGSLCVMSLTDGATPQDTRLIPFKLIQRPMYPLDEI